MKYRFEVSCQFGGRHEEVIEFDHEDIQGMSPEQIEEYVSGLYDDWLLDQCNGGWEKVE